MELIKIGVDVGNYDTKKQNCTVISGYKKYETKQEIATMVCSGHLGKKTICR